MLLDILWTVVDEKPVQSGENVVNQAVIDEAVATTVQLDILTSTSINGYFRHQQLYFSRNRY